MNRKEITDKLSRLLENKLFRDRVLFANEVTFDFGYSKGTTRVDYMSFAPENQMSVVGIERGVATCYEVKSCVADFESGHGLNFFGDKNYLVTTMETYKKLMNKRPRGVGVYVAKPVNRDTYDEFENPTDFSDECEWELVNVIPSTYAGNRKKSASEILFCMFRSYSNGGLRGGIKNETD